MSDPNLKKEEMYLRQGKTIYTPVDKMTGKREVWRDCASISFAKHAVRTELKFKAITK